MAEVDCQWYYTRRGVTYGPFPRETIVRLVEGRFLRADSYVWDAGQGGDWRPVSSFPAFADALSRAEEGDRTIDPSEWCALAGQSAPPPSAGENRPRMADVLASAWRWTVLSLFRPFRFLQWAGIAFCSWMACTSSLIGIFDEDTLLREMQGGMQSGAQVVTALCLSARQWAVQTVSGQGVWFWGAMAVFYLVIACFIRAKGRLLFLHRLRFPGDSIQAAWAATNGRALPLAICHFSLDALFVVVEVCTVLHLFLNLSEATIQTGDVQAIFSEIVSKPSSRACGFLFLGVIAGLTVIRSILYHFIEPVYYRLHLSFHGATSVILRLFLTQIPAVLAFFVSLVLVRLLVLGAGGLLALCVTLAGAPVLAVLPLLLPYLIRLVFLPADYFIRSLGPRFLAAWRGLW